MRILGLVEGCADCPSRAYYSGGRYECRRTGSVLPPLESLNGRPVEWCPLAEYPSAAFESMREEVAALRRASLATPAGGEEGR